MNNAELFNINLDTFVKTPVLKHVELLQTISERKILNNEFGFRYNVQVIDVGNSNIWVRLNIFHNSNDKHTFTLFTLYCNELYSFPLTIDGFSLENPIVCTEYEELTNNLVKVTESSFDLKIEPVLYSLSNYTKPSPIVNKPDLIREVPGIMPRITKELKKRVLWSDSENQIFLNIMDAYRTETQGSQPRRVKDITRVYAFKLKEEHEILRHRTEQAIYEHLSYFDDLLAGVGNTDDYAIKDAKYFCKKTRYDNNKIPNPARVIRFLNKE